MTRTLYYGDNYANAVGPELGEVFEKKVCVGIRTGLWYGDKWVEERLGSGTTILVVPPITHCSVRGGLHTPAQTAVFGASVSSLVSVKNHRAYETVCKFDNLDVVRQLEFAADDRVLVESCVISAFRSPNASYRVAGYLLNPHYPVNFTTEERVALAGFWAQGFDGLPWPVGSSCWLDEVKDGPEYTWKSATFPDVTQKLCTVEPQPPRGNSELMPAELRTRTVKYQIPTAQTSNVDDKRYNEMLQTQQFLNQVSKLFVLMEVYGHEETMLYCSFFLSSPSSDGYQFFNYRNQQQIISVQAAKTAAKVVAKLIGRYVP